VDIIAQNPRFFLMPTVSTIAVRVSDTASILRGGICVYMKTTALKKINEWLKGKKYGTKI